MTNLRQLLKNHEHLSTERAKMLAEEIRAKEIEAGILAGGQINDSEVSALSNARTLRELIARRLPDLENMLKKLDVQIQTELQRCSSRFNRAVLAAVEAKKAEVTQALTPFFPGAVRQLKKVVESLPCPALYELGRCFYSTPSSGNPGLDFWARAGRQFLEKIARVERRFAIVAN